MITSIQVVNRFRMNLVINELYPAPKGRFAVISIYSSPSEELISLVHWGKLQAWGCVGVLSQMFQDGGLPKDAAWLQHPFLPAHAKEIKNFLDRIHSMDKKVFLIAHCDAGISRSGAVANFSADYLDIPFEDEYIIPNPYVSRILNEQIWREQWNT